ncbi:MAG: bifunctional phosphopantothenoylcysteine decarboxylase/phosphopantothenate--cysteine ligase CoaBC [Xanthomonadales bacterium]|nr:bifunctional phosphopantothenoylcysteine decarboxylase/phosphopantothenate--cysteine ligase CoaBC [Xanthomonadales bacterium]
MNSLIHKHILLGITGGIAAYKSADLVRRLREQGADVRVVMTRSACEFITPLTLQALSGHRVSTDLLDEAAEAAMGHIELARWADLVLVAPCSANFMARYCHGLADDLLATLCLATTEPVILAPALNQQMWQATATQANVELLKSRGVPLLGPGVGDQACGETGPGRMLEPDEIVAAINQCFQTGLLTGQQVLVTAGPTREYIDPVRYLSNRSSGRMGYAIARAASEAGASVTLISGPTALEPPEAVSLVSVETAGEMHRAVMERVGQAGVFISAAAVADYACPEVAKEKIKKDVSEFSLTLNKTADILSEVAALARPPFTVGFAAETSAVEDNARSKLMNKRLDLIAANRVGDGLGFDTEDNALQLYWEGGSLDLGQASKDKLARQLIQVIAQRYEEKYRHQDPGSETRH